MTKAWLNGALLAAALLAAAQPALGHHSYGMFDAEKMLVWEGTLVRFDWMNPHSHLIVAVPPAAKDPATVGTWDIEGTAPNIMSRQGWTRSTLQPGDKVTVVGQPLKDGRKGGALYYIVKDGVRLYVDVSRKGGPGAGARGVPAGVELP